MIKSTLKLGVLCCLCVLTFSACTEVQVKGTETEMNRPLAKELEVFWELKENGHKEQAKALTAFTIKNNSVKSLKQNWELYFHQPRTVVPKSFGENIEITHINGDYFKMQPTNKFAELKTGETVSLEFLNEAWFLKQVDAPSGVYMVFRDSLGVESPPELLENITVLPITTGSKISIDGVSFLEIATAKDLFTTNAKTRISKKSTLCPITPTPIKFETSEGSYDLLNGATVSFGNSLKSEANFLIKKIKKDFGVTIESTSTEGNIVLSVDSTLSIAGKNKGAYSLLISEKGIEIVGSDASGVFYGVQSLRSLVPVSNYAAKSDALNFSYSKVEDAPRFEYRGMHLDVVRNFQEKEDVLRLLDMMAFYKLNKFHFHISDDEGWRLSIDGLPELTDVGSRRGHTKDESDMINPAYGSGPYPSDESNGTGHYSREDFVEILKYATERHVEVIPELDFPGHARAAIISMKARQKRLMAEGREKEANEFILHDPNDASKYKSIQLYDDNVICVCQKSTYDFIEKVVDDVVSMYKEAGVKLENIHTGGDEVPHPSEDDPENGVWSKSPKCVNFMEANEAYDKPEELFYYFVDRFSTILQERGIETAGWEEIGLKKVLNEDEELIPVVNEDFLTRNFKTYIWNTVWTWGAEDRGYKLANAGYQVVLANVNNLYFDLAYDKDPNDPGYYWGGFVDTRKAWNFVPLNFYSEDVVDRWGNLLPDSVSRVDEKERLTEKGKNNILGIQGQLWAETVKGSKLMEYYLYPKMLGLVERAWAKDPSWDVIKDEKQKDAKIQTDWNDFSSKLGYFEFPRLTYMNGGFNYRIAPAGAVIEEGKLFVNCAFPNFEYRYTLDGSEPNKASTLYQEPIAIDAGVLVKVKVFNEKGRSSKTSTVH